MTQAQISKILEKGLARVKKQNPQLSKRALAKSIGISSSYLSKIFGGKRLLPPRLLGALARTLHLDHHETAELHRLILAAVEQRDLSPKTGLRTLQSGKENVGGHYKDLGAEDLWLLEEWYYLPLLNLVTTENFRIETMASRLGVTEEKAQKALRKLQKAHFLQMSPSGHLVRTDLKVRFPTGRSHKEVRRFHRDMIRKALPLLDQPTTEKDFAERLISGITFAGDPRTLLEAKILIEEALYKAAERMASGTCTEVFQVNLQLFKLTSR